MKVEQTLWVEKYRPDNINDIVLSEEYSEEIKGFMHKKDIPNILLSGPAGGGKTTLARIITSPSGVLNHPKSNLLSLNGSSQEARGINYVQNVIEPFLKVPPAGGDKYKIVFIDEGDNLTIESFKSLRGVIEKYQIKYGRFILTCNYLSKIPEPVQSRFTAFVFKQIPIEFVMEYCTKIFKAESVEFKEDDLRFVIDNLYPDIRKITNTIQRMSVNGVFKVNKDIALTTEKAIIGSICEIIKYVKNKQNSKINKEIANIINLCDKHDLEFAKIYSSLFTSSNVPVPAKIVTNKYSNSHQNCLVPSMHFTSMVFEIINAVDSYYKNVS